MNPKIAMCNFISDMGELKDFALENGFMGIDWSFQIGALPETPAMESAWVNEISRFDPLEVRYHCPFLKVDIGHHNPEKVKSAMALFRKVIRLVSKAGGKYLTLHVGLGHNTTKILSWDETAGNLRRLIQYGGELGVTVCLENLAWGWTSKPNLFEKLVRKTGAGVTFDIGHAHACESIHSQHYEAEDFITPHAGRIFNAHVYHTEISGVGHIPPDSISDIQSRLEVLLRNDCKWWTIEIREENELLKTKEMIDAFLCRENPLRAPIGPISSGGAEARG